LRTDDQLQPNARCAGPLGEIDALLVIGDAAADDAHMRRLELSERCILIRDAGAHRIDHVHAHNHLLRTSRCKRQQRDRNGKNCDETVQPSFAHTGLQSYLRYREI
jgi:hypothetical protein